MHFQDHENLVILAFSGGGTRAAAGTIIMASPEFQRLLKDAGLRVRFDAPSADPAPRALP
jgi:hypothetical protein